MRLGGDVNIGRNFPCVLGKSDGLGATRRRESGTPPYTRALFIMCMGRGKREYRDISSLCEDAVCQSRAFPRGKGGGRAEGGKGTRRNHGISLERGTTGPFLSVFTEGEVVGMPPACGEYAWRVYLENEGECYAERFGLPLAAVRNGGSEPKSTKDMGGPA